MGIYFNPGNSGFQRIVNSEYVDKTGLIRLINETIGTVNNLTCVSTLLISMKICAMHGKGMENRYRSPSTIISGTSFSGIPFQLHFKACVLERSAVEVKRVFAQFARGIYWRGHKT